MCGWVVESQTCILTMFGMDGILFPKVSGPPSLSTHLLIQGRHFWRKSFMPEIAAIGREITYTFRAKWCLGQPDLSAQSPCNNLRSKCTRQFFMEIGVVISFWKRVQVFWFRGSDLLAVAIPFSMKSWISFVALCRVCGDSLHFACD